MGEVLGRSRRRFNIGNNYPITSFSTLGIVQEKDEKPPKSSNKESDREPLSDFSTLPTSEDKGPLWEVVIQFGKQTTFNYGPWADR